ncbi:hypothetical protein CY34DRAFT_7682 [Suillus luteus UH-Slu-Lm8-n1]|uniref:Uncharacterized protein n=1 Tax=Suillus luteus UH-Slu-Lm8-n1 TaxID=930992 RepID=A0A0D0BTV2_9AGAM|nr:hypothetical protein CY34DRAFT_7682 [Suillus luteus UH-Slu-Lm8-n1]
MSPASTASPPMPPGMEDCAARIVSASSSPGIPKHEPVPVPPPSKHKMFAFTSPAVWRRWLIERTVVFAAFFLLPLIHSLLLDFSLAWMPDGTRLFSAGGDTDPTIREWDTSNWKQVGEPWKGHFKSIQAISLNSTGTLLASASDDNGVRLWQVSDRRTIVVFKHRSAVQCVTFSADDRRILSGDQNKAIFKWAVPEDALPDTLLESESESSELTSTEGSEGEARED